MILYAEGQNPAGDKLAKDVLEMLWEKYPGHPWSAQVTGGVLFIKHLGFGKNWGMIRHLKSVDFDAAVLKRQVTMAAGEFLERANLRRAAANGEQIKRLEGVPERDQPVLLKDGRYA